MPFKFAANTTFLFQDSPTLESRYAEVQKAGFKFVECTFPYGEPVEKLKEALEKTGLEHVMIHAYPGDTKKGELGLAALPGRESDFKESLELSIKYANALNCKRVHVMAGKIPEGTDAAGREKMEATYIENLRYAVDRLSKEGIITLIEPVNDRLSVPRYFLTNPQEALRIVKLIDNPNLKIKFDCFHIQIMDGNLTKKLIEFSPYIGHIHVAQVPDRGEPNEEGEINYPHIFRTIESLNYDGYIGLEYKPRGKTEDGLGWMKGL